MCVYVTCRHVSTPWQFMLLPHTLYIDFCLCMFFFHPGQRKKSKRCWHLLIADGERAACRNACILNNERLALRFVIRGTELVVRWEGTNKNTSKFNKYGWQRASETQRGVGKYEASIIDSWFYIVDLWPFLLCFSLPLHAHPHSNLQMYV